MNKEYWEKNIQKWSKLYLDISHADEKFGCPGFVERIYHALITPIERSLMKKRYHKTIAYFDAYVKPGTVVADLGCGSGIFTVELLRRGAEVRAVDFTQASLEMTRQLVASQCPELIDRVQYFQMDITQQMIPRCDAAFAMGVTPYVEDIETFYDNVLPQTQVFYCQMVDPTSPANLLRRALPMLNVRRLRFHHKRRLDAIYKKHRWTLKRREIFATGYIDLAEVGAH